MSDLSLYNDGTIRDLLAKKRSNLGILELQKAEYANGEVPLRLENAVQAARREVAALAAEQTRREQLPRRDDTGEPPPSPAAGAGNPFDGPSPASVGRDAEIQRILEKLQRGHCSLVGPSGSGKSLLLKSIQQRAAAAPGWSAAGETLALNCGLLGNLSQLQQAVADRLGVEARRLSARLRSQPPRLLLLDDLGGMDRGETGYKMRRWLRGLADDVGTRLLMVSHQRLDMIFASDDPARGSLLAALDTRPVELGPLSPAACLALIESRLAGGNPRAGGWDAAAFADLAAAPLQPRELLHRCAERADALLDTSR